MSETHGIKSVEVIGSESHQNSSASSPPRHIKVHIFMHACGAPSTIDHSYRRATIGCTDVARHAGIEDAANATSRSRTTTAVKVSKSAVLT